LAWLGTLVPEAGREYKLVLYFEAWFEYFGEDLFAGSYGEGKRPRCSNELRWVGSKETVEEETAATLILFKPFLWRERSIFEENITWASVVPCIKKFSALTPTPFSIWMWQIIMLNHFERRADQMLE
jgi:hypothetical protein